MNAVQPYSIVILPSEEIIKFIGNLKLSLYTESEQDYGSRNSMAHITVREFEATDHQLRRTILKLCKIAREQEIFKTKFDQVICSDQSRSAFASPDIDSHQYFKKLMKKIRTEIAGKANSDAHISIGRQLSTEQLEISREIFSNVKLDFQCTRIALRKFNHKMKQFEIVKIFPFLNEPDSEQQLTLDL